MELVVEPIYEEPYAENIMNLGTLTMLLVASPYH